MKLSKLIAKDPFSNRDLTENMLFNALHEIDLLEETLADLECRISYYETILGKLQNSAELAHGTYDDYIMVHSIYREGDPQMFQELINVFSLAKEKEEDES